MVDDEPNIIDGTVYLEREGYQVVSAANGNDKQVALREQ
ncbi:response regulator transcription factor [Paenibacillus sp. SYP-B3998]|uniref:Response regulator transcription factor n=1 Tax=Paenibacillus sp. SYP-B3998 TaxID=2678564 RepID=A0A6G4A620_9BACL|nr:response regulator transcription factor [Paenibacillus sp. SYP-B3998]